MCSWWMPEHSFIPSQEKRTTSDFFLQVANVYMVVKIQLVYQNYDDDDDHYHHLKYIGSLAVAFQSLHGCSYMLYSL